MKLHPLQSSFQGGELSPRMLGRTDTDQYKNGLAICENMVVDARGPVRNRAGSAYFEEDPTECAALEIIQTTVNEYFNLFFTDLSLRIFTRFGPLPVTNYINNPTFNEGGDHWSTDEVGAGSVARFHDGICQLHTGSSTGSEASVWQGAVVADGTILQHITFETDGLASYTVNIGTTEHGTDLHTSSSTATLFEVDVTHGGAGAQTIWCELVLDTKSSDLDLYRVGVKPNAESPVQFATPWPCDAIQDLYYVEEPGGLLMYILHPNYPPQELVYDPALDSFSFGAVTFVDQPAEWTGTSYPGCGAIFQGRLWLGSTSNEPSTFWGSQSGAYEDFSVSAPIVSADAILSVSMERFGRIQWMEGTKNLVIGSTTGEYLVVADGGLLQPSDLSIKRQSAYGSKRIQAVHINERLFYVSGDGRKIRTMYFEFATNNWVSDDILFVSEHLSEAGIIDIRWAPNPDNLLWALLEDGTLISCTYERGNKILGWHRHSTTGRRN